MGRLSHHLNRRLAAIAFADVADFSRLMASNEADTVQQWKALRTEILEPYVDQEGGRVAEVAGDALLVEFPSAVNSVRWAVDLQQALAGRQIGPSGHGLSLRIGINVEDVIDDNGLLQGDGVNIAARIHQAAEPGQIVVTAAVKDYVAGRLPVTFHDLGTPPLKNIARRSACSPSSYPNPSAGDSTVQPYLQWSTRPTVAVLPSTAWRFHSLTIVWCTPCFVANCAVVSSPGNASRATFALNSAAYLFRLPVIRSVLQPGQTKLKRPSDFPGPPQSLTKDDVASPCPTNEGSKCAMWAEYLAMS